MFSLIEIRFSSAKVGTINDGGLSGCHLEDNKGEGKQIIEVLCRWQNCGLQFFCQQNSWANEEQDE